MIKQMFQLKSLVLLPILSLVLFSCEKNVDNSPVIEREFDLTGFNKISAGEQFKLTVTKGNDFFIKVKGPTNSVNEMDVNVSNNILNIGYTRHRNNRPVIEVTITLPVLSTVHLSGAATGNVSGFEGSPIVMRAILSGASILQLTGTGINTSVEISGASRLDVSGITESLSGNISGAGRLDAYDLQADEVDITVSGGSTAYVSVGNSLFVVASGGSKVYYKGDPVTKNIEATGGSQVIKE